MNDFEFLNRFTLVAKKSDLFVVFRAVNPRREPNKRGLVTDQVDHIPVCYEYQDGTRETRLFSASSALDELERGLGAIAIKTGGLLMALDCDNPKAIEWVESRLEEPTLITHSGNPNESRHYWFQLSEPIRTVGKINSGKECEIEVKNGANLTVYGTYRKDTSRRYGYIDNPIQPIPSAILEAIRTEYKAKGHLSIAEMSDAEYREHWERDFKIAKSIAEYYRNHCYTGNPETDPIPDHNTWIKVMYGLFSLSVYDEVLELAEMLTWEEYLPDLYRQYHSFESDHEQFGNLINWAKSIGWKLPKELYTAEYGSDEAVLFKASEDEPKDRSKLAKRSALKYNGQTFTEFTQDRVRYDAKLGYFLRRDKHWEHLGHDTFEIEKLTAEFLIGCNSSTDTKRVNALIYNERVRWSLKGIEENSLIGFRNGVLDVETGRFIDWDSELFVRRYYDLDYNPSSQKPEKFLRFLGDLFPKSGDRIIPIIRAFMNCVLRVDTSHQKFLVLVGEGGTGKSVLAKIMELIAGKGNYVSTWISLLQSHHGTEALIGKSFISIKEVEKSERRMDSPVIKSIVGGDDLPISPKGERIFSMPIKANLLIMSNSFLDFRDEGGAMTRRIIQIGVEASTKDIQVKKNPRLFEELSAELPAILNWILECEDPVKILEDANLDHDAAIARTLLQTQLESDQLAASIMDLVNWGQPTDSELKRAIFNSRQVYDAIKRHYKQATGLEIGDPSIWSCLQRLAKIQGVQLDKRRSSCRTYRFLVGVWIDQKTYDALIEA